MNSQTGITYIKARRKGRSPNYGITTDTGRPIYVGKGLMAQINGEPRFTDEELEEEFEYFDNWFKHDGRI